MRIYGARLGFRSAESTLATVGRLCPTHVCAPSPRHLARAARSRRVFSIPRYLILSKIQRNTFIDGQHGPRHGPSWTIEHCPPCHKHNDNRTHDLLISSGLTSPHDLSSTSWRRSEAIRRRRARVPDCGDSRDRRGRPRPQLAGPAARASDGPKQIAKPKAERQGPNAQSPKRARKAKESQRRKGENRNVVTCPVPRPLPPQADRAPGGDS